MQRVIKVLDFINYWSIVLLPFFMAIAPAPMNVFMGFIIASFFFKKILLRQKLFTATGVNQVLLFFFLATCLSLINSISLRDSLRGGILRLLQNVFVFFALVDGIRDRKHIGAIITAASCGLVLVSMDAFWQVLRGEDFIRGYLPTVNIGLTRATASFKDANTFGIYLSAWSPLLLGITLFFLSGWKKKAMILVSLITLGGIALTFSRPTLLAIYVVMFFLAIAKKAKPLMIFLIVITIASPFLLPRSVKEFARQVNYNPLIFMCNDDRIAIYCNSLNMIRHHPVIGVGANNFMINYQRYKENPEYKGIVTLDFAYAHNNFLHMAGELGLIGLSLFLWFVIRLFWLNRRIYLSLGEKFLKIVSLSLIGCLIAFLVNGLTESSLYSARVALSFWYLAGFSLALGGFCDEKRTQ